INSRPAQNQHNSSKIPTSTTQQQQTSPIQNNNLEIHTLNQRPPSNDMNSSQKVVNVVNSFSLPNDDEELQAWIMNILKDPEYPQFSGKVMEDAINDVRLMINMSKLLLKS
ncbi:15843_t:CDS:2, partial [Racocetra persica]